MQKGYLLMIFILILTISCRQGGKSSDCEYGSPTAIFNADQPGIQQHSFALQGNEAREEVIFSDGLELTLLQSGCDNIRQEFQFNLKGNFSTQTPDFWITQAIQKLKRLGSMGYNYNGFSQWAQFIEAQKGNMKLAESTALEPGFYVQIDRILGVDNATLVLILSNTP